MEFLRIVRDAVIAEFAMTTGHRVFNARNAGSSAAPALHMCARHFSELICWQLARELQRDVFKITCKEVFRRDLDLRSQLRAAAGSVKRNIAEGFGRRTHKDMAHLFHISLASIYEVEDELREALDKGYVTAEEIIRALNLCKRTFSATSRFRRSVMRRPDPPWNLWPRRHKARP